ncbi:hypothetical protein N9112_01570 [bacterium]|nr:hypothetical protein [bacterium]
MNILKNKHLILAMFVAPTLAIIAYFSVDYVVSEKPQAAIQGGTYKLAAKSNCRYQSGVCTLKNGDIEVKLHARRIDERMVELNMHSGLPIQNAIISYVVGEFTSEPVAMDTESAAASDWYVTIELPDPENSQLRMALSIADAMYYAETTAVFIDYETSFSRDNFSE